MRKNMKFPRRGDLIKMFLLVYLFEVVVKSSNTTVSFHFSLIFSQKAQFQNSCLSYRLNQVSNYVKLHFSLEKAKILY